MSNLNRGALLLLTTLAAACGSDEGAFSTNGGNDAATGDGGAESSGNGGTSGGAKGTSGATNTGGRTSNGGRTGQGGASGNGGVTHSGGASSNGGTTNTGGRTSNGGRTSSGGATGGGGVTHSGGASSNGGAFSNGGASGTDAGSDAGSCAQTAIVLGAASDFAVLAGSTVTSTGPTSVTGDLGISPGTALTGFGPGTIVGTEHLGDPTSAQAIASLTTAYNDAAGRTLCPVSVAGNLGGQTLTPGLYKSTSSLAISSGDLTLDANGDGNAVFIFQMASTLTTTSGRQVILINGADAANVYWQVGTSATLGSTSSFQGTIMADQAITLNTGATLHGRALARVAAVALDTNTIVRPAP